MQHKPVKFYDKYYVARAPPAPMPCHPMKSQRRLQKISASISLVILTLGFSFLGLVSFVNKPHADLPKVTCVDEAAKTLTYHIERCTFPPWDGTTAPLTLRSPRRTN